MKTTLRLTIAALGLAIFNLSTLVVEAQSYTNNYGIWAYTTTNGTVTITGYTGSGGDVAIPERIPDTTNGLPVTTIGDWAFSYTALTSVTIPNSVTNIGHCAFFDCSSLTSVTIPNSVTSIGDGAFFNCTNLTNVTIPDSVTVIKEGSQYMGGPIPAFGNCTRLTSVTIGNGVTSIGGYTFSGCTSLASVTIGNSVTDIGDWAFESCTSLASITIPESVTNIDHGAFFGCSSLTSVTIPNSVTSIGNEAFGSCTSLTSVTIGSSVTNIGEAAFEVCTSLRGAYFKGNAPAVDPTGYPPLIRLCSQGTPPRSTTCRGTRDGTQHLVVFRPPFGSPRCRPVTPLSALGPINSGSTSIGPAA